MCGLPSVCSAGRKWHKQCNWSTQAQLYAVARFSCSKAAQLHSIRVRLYVGQSMASRTVFSHRSRNHVQVLTMTQRCEQRRQSLAALNQCLAGVEGAEARWRRRVRRVCELEYCGAKGVAAASAVARTN